MSAFIVDKAHIDLLVAGITEGTRDGIVTGRPCDRDRLGQLLVNECVASVSHRYPEDKPGELPGPTGEHAYYVRPYQYTERHYRPTAGELYKAIDSYDYQSCEHPAWGQSGAKRLCDLIRAAIRQRVPAARGQESDGGPRWVEWDAALWHIDADHVAVLYARNHPEGQPLVAYCFDHPAESYALSDWLMDRGILNRPLDLYPQTLKGLAEPVRVRCVPESIDRDAAIKRIKSALRRRSGKPWSVTGGRGTAYSWITIDAPPARRTWRWVQTRTPEPPAAGAIYRGAGGVTPPGYTDETAEHQILSPADDPWAREAIEQGRTLVYDWEVNDPDYEFGHAAPDERAELARLLGLERGVHHQGVSVSPEERAFYVERAEGQPAAVASAR